MPVELLALAAACLLGLVHVGAQGLTYKAQVGNAYSVGPRDEETPPAGVAGRLQRAQRNFGETFPIFAAAVLAVVVAGKTGQISAAGCALYLGGRICYLPAYATGLPWVRTVFWQIATVGIVVVLAALVWPT